MLLIPTFFIFIWNPDSEKSLVQSLSSKEECIVTNAEPISDEITIEENNNTEELNNQSILKVDIEVIKNELTNKYGSVINSICEKLSVVDLSIIEKLLNKDNQEGVVRDIITLLQKRLSKEDYNNLINILIPYIDFDAI